MSGPRKDQVALKNSLVKPSSPGDFFFGKFITTSSTSERVISRSRARFCSRVIKRGICRVILSIATYRLGVGSERRSLKWLTSSFSISSCLMSRSPFAALREKILLCWCRCNMALWKNFVLRSPSLSQFIYDFCFHNSSSFLCLSSCWLRVLPSSIDNSGVRPDRIICCCIAFIFSFS